jgi:NAD(P)-dependent dehydrogenase (short-subunit alcohol dehydrogenase family)
MARHSFRQTYKTKCVRRRCGHQRLLASFAPIRSPSYCQRVQGHLVARGEHWSQSQFAYQTGGKGAVYRSSKAALNALTVYYAEALAAQGFKVNALAPGLRATHLNPRAAASGGDPAEAAAGAVRLALLPDDGPSGQFFS